MNRPDDGGPAFPRPYSVDGRHGSGPFEDGDLAESAHTGMTLRDWFAGQALSGLLAGRGDRVLGEPEIYASVAYRMADALLARRERGGGS